VDVDITPEPTPEERAAILAALALVRARDGGDPGAWWRTGLRENLDDEGES
jgi:hypothetical protein